MENNKITVAEKFLERLDAIRTLQAEVTFAMLEDGITSAQARELILKYKLFDYIEAGYEILHLSGLQGIMEDIYEYLREKGASFNVRA